MSIELEMSKNFDKYIFNFKTVDVAIAFTKNAIFKSPSIKFQRDHCSFTDQFTVF